jgi:hypothetical protein
MALEMKRKKLAGRIALAVLMVFMGIQFIRPPKNEGVADASSDITHFVTVPDTVRKILKRSCYDCHSNHTNYPWYARISPASLWLARHIKEGKAELNFTDFAQYSRRRMNTKLSSIAEQVEEREMPLKSYLWMHGAARLSGEEIRLISRWTETAREELKQKP